MRNHDALTGEALARRQFLSQLGKSAATAPAIALLLSASSKSAAAQYRGASGNNGSNGNGGSNGRVHPPGRGPR